MKVRVKMEDGREYMGIKGGFEGGFMYLFFPKEMEGDPKGEDPEDEKNWERNVIGTSEEGGHILLPVKDIKIILAEVR